LKDAKKRKEKAKKKKVRKKGIGPDPTLPGVACCFLSLLMSCPPLADESFFINWEPNPTLQ
jgi:hypothetical protein